MSIHESTPVRIISGAYAGETGKVVSVYEIIGTVTVALEDGRFVKASMSEIVEVLPQESNEIPEGAKRITPEIVKNAIAEVVSPERIFASDEESETKFLRGISTMIVGENFRKKLFNDEDVLILTEDQFIAEMWRLCSPASVAETVGGQMSDMACTSIALAACAILRDIVPIIFDEPDND